MKKLLLVVAAVAAVGIGIIAVAGAGAQEGVTGDRPLDRWVAKVAERLGLTEAEVTDAMQGAQFDLIDEAVANGEMTQEQADALKARIEEYGIVVPRPNHNTGDRLRCAAAKFSVNAAAEVLGMETDALIEEVKAGKTLAEIAEAQGMNVEDFKAALLAQTRETLDAKVAAGDITQEQADKLYQAFESHIDEIVNHQADPEHNPCRSRHDGPGHEGQPAPEGSDS